MENDEKKTDKTPDVDGGRKKKPIVGFVSIGLEAVAILFYILCETRAIDSPDQDLFWVAIVLLPIAGLICGIVGVSYGKKSMTGLPHFICSLVGLLLPLVIVALIIILMSSGVLVIALM